MNFRIILNINIKDIYDIDGSTTFIENYIGCSMNPDFENFIGRKIGTSDGEYLQKSSYITLEISDDYDFNNDPFSGYIGYINGTGSLYKVLAPTNAIEFTYNDGIIATITDGNGFSGSVVGIGNVSDFSSSVDYRLSNLSVLTDAGVWA